MDDATEHLGETLIVRKLCVDLSKTAIMEAEERLSSYVKIMIKIFEKIEGGSLD
jgi:hypothetical protein